MGAQTLSLSSLPSSTQYMPCPVATLSEKVLGCQYIGSSTVWSCTAASSNTQPEPSTGPGTEQDPAGWWECVCLPVPSLGPFFLLLPMAPGKGGPGKGKSGPSAQVCRVWAISSCPLGSGDLGGQAGSSISLSRACQLPGSVGNACEVTSAFPLFMM